MRIVSARFVLIAATAVATVAHRVSAVAPRRAALRASIHLLRVVYINAPLANGSPARRVFDDLAYTA
jgi:hypothetical protein